MMLPRTFQEAIDIIRRLGVRYLWIDALCIIQGDTTDWLREAPQMVSIYQNAYLAVAATASSDSNGGCYRTTPSECYERKFMYGSKRGGIPVYVREAIPHFDGHSTDDVAGREFPLLQRAWVYQERTLSSRMLHFCNKELLLECKEDTHCQCGELTVYENTMKVLLLEMLRKQNVKLPTVWKWPEFVEGYTNLKMSFDEDRLPAISGIARCEAKRSEDSWRFEHKHQYFATLVRAECSLVDNDVFGRVRSGTMTLAGRVMPSLLSWLTSEETDPQEPGWRVATFDCLPYNKGMDDRFLFQFGADDLFNLDGPSPMTVHCLWLFSNVHSLWVGLILRQVGSRFERIGMFSAALREGEVPWDVVEAGC
ncbi:hypothetical protein NW759_014714 [Fusarium solani]|nr:hypothetical protein NW759_014714 [Fusarium solani]